MEYLIVYGYIFIFGLIIGSFLNVCIYRLPKQEDIVSGRSHCMQCGNVLKWYDLIPVLSFLVLRGRCRNCRCRLSVQYPLIELLNGLLYVFTFYRTGFTVEGILYCLCGSALIVVTVIDWRTLTIPDGCNIFIFLLGAVRLVLNLSDWSEYVIGFVAVSTFFALIRLITKGKGIGGGDIKLMAAAGLLVGWQKILAALVIGCIAGSVIHLCRMKLSGTGKVLAFGPYLSLGIAAVMLYGDRLIGWYLNLYR